MCTSNIAPLKSMIRLEAPITMIKTSLVVLAEENNMSNKDSIAVAAAAPSFTTKSLDAVDLSDVTRRRYRRQRQVSSRDLHKTFAQAA